MVTIHPAWLGHYSCGGDPEDGGRRRLHLWRPDPDTVGFEFLYEARSNHGFELVFHEGTVVAVSEHEITVELAMAHSSTNPSSPTDPSEKS